jgi:beta-lactamase regulating signal transducer with metallopeptidase domain
MPAASIAGAVQLWEEWALVATWQLAALAALVWVCEKALRLRQPRVRHALWWFVLVAPLVLAPGRMALARRQAVVTVPAPGAVERVVTVVQLPAPEPAAPAALRPASPAVTRHGRPPYSDLHFSVALAWALGCALLLGRLIVGHVRVRMMLRASRPVKDPGALGLLAELLRAAQASACRVDLRESESLGAPLLYGFRPTILLPAGWPDSLSGDELRGLLAHEVAHVKRRDYLESFVQQLADIPLFFHPGAWLAKRGITLAREELADAWALATGTDASSYARSLAAVAERAQARLSVALVGVAEGRSTLLRRVEAIMQGESLGRLSRPLMAAIVAIGLLSAAAFSAVQLRGEAKQTIMPPILEGIHLTYRVTSQRPALPPECVEQHIAAVRAQHATDVVSEQLLRTLASRLVAGPEKTETAYYWGTMHGFMYAVAKGGCVAYDGKKSASGAALYMVPDLIQQPTAEHSGMSIAWGTSLISGAVVPYLGIYQPGTELFDNAVTLGETVPLATGEKRIYPLPFRRKATLEYDEEGRVRTLTITGDDEAIVIDEYRFADYATVDGVRYPREVRRKKVAVFRGTDGEIAQVPDWLVCWQVVDASAGPIPESFFALSTARPGAQVEDGRYQVPGRNEPGITYRYSDPSLSIDEASERAYQSILRQQE